MKSSSEILKSYKSVYDKFLQKDIIEFADIKSSIDIFEYSSLRKRNPIPKKFEVFAVISGIPFDIDFVAKIVHIQRKLIDFFGNKLNYMVKKNNLAVEFCVLKWPEDPVSESIIDQTISTLRLLELRRFSFKIVGIQIHLDGCIILKGISEKMKIHSVRSNIMKSINGFPEKQSNWSHVPIGRLLEPLNKTEKDELVRLIDSLNNTAVPFQTYIDKIHVVHESRWYMESVEVLFSKGLIS